MSARPRVAMLAALASVLIGGSGACRHNDKKAHAIDPARDDVAAAVRAFLKQRGDLCLGKSAWPILVTGQDLEQRTNDALQMPVLERLGLVTSAQGEAGRSYALTELGRRFYLDRKTPEPSRDLCAGKIELDKVVAVKPQAGNAGEPWVIVQYTYRFAAADWVRDAEVQAVFPMLARIVSGERALPMELRFKRTQTGWVVLEPRA